MQVSSTKTKTGESVLIGGVLSVEFAGEIGIEDHGIVRREMVMLVTKGANLGGEDDASIKVENRGTGFAVKQSVGDIRVRADWRNGGNEWGLRTCLLQPWFVATRSNSSELRRLPLDLRSPFPTFFFFTAFFFFFSFLLTMKIIIKKRKSNWCSFEHLTKKDN